MAIQKTILKKVHYCCNHVKYLEFSVSEDGKYFTRRMTVTLVHTRHCRQHTTS